MPRALRLPCPRMLQPCLPHHYQVRRCPTLLPAAASVLCRRPGVAAALGPGGLAHRPQPAAAAGAGGRWGQPSSRGHGGWLHVCSTCAMLLHLPAAQALCCAWCSLLCTGMPPGYVALIVLLTATFPSRTASPSSTQSLRWCRRKCWRQPRLRRWAGCSDASGCRPERAAMEGKGPVPAAATSACHQATGNNTRHVTPRLPGRWWSWSSG